MHDIITLYRDKYDTSNVLHKIYDKSSNIDCELITYALDNIV